ncbi:MAG: hypothetical protein AB8B61_05750, partial [Cyclobacteriaceae bacterium]
MNQLFRFITHRKSTPFLVFLIGFIVKIFFVSERSIAHDEPFTIFHAQMSVRNIKATLPIENN